VHRRTFLRTVAGSLLAAPLAVEAQTSTTSKVHSVGLLVGTTDSDTLTRERTRLVHRPYVALPPLRLEELQQALEAAGYERERVRVELSPAGAGSFPSLETQAKDLVRRGVEIIVALGTPATLAAKAASSTLPIVMVGVADPVAQGLVQSLPRPGGNITGLSLLGPEILVKSLDLILAAIPNNTRVSIMWNATNPGAALSVNQLETTAATLGVALIRVPVSQWQDVEHGLRGSHFKALIVVSDPLFTKNALELIWWTTGLKLPTMFQSRDWVELGGVMAYEPDFGDLIHRAGSYVSKILQGAKPADLPIEQPTKFKFVINLKTAKALGLTIPQSLLQRADQVIE
jgi:ABC-type uncharacterized transport system substrate-binding protein